MKRASVLWSVLVSLAVAPGLARSQPSAEQRQALLAYKLTRPLADKLLAALPEMTRYSLVELRADFHSALVLLDGRAPKWRLSVSQAARHGLIPIDTLDRLILRAQT